MFRYNACINKFKFFAVMRFLLFVFAFSCSTHYQLKSQVVVYNAGNMQVTGGTELFINGSTLQSDSANVDLQGQITLLGDFINSVGKGNIFTIGSAGTILFTGSSKQKINGTAQKDVNYIAFPNVDINKDAEFVEMDPAMGADMKQLNLQKGKLLLKSDGLADSKEISSYNSLVPSRIAHLRVNQVLYNRNIALGLNQKGVVEVEMTLPDQPDRQRKMFGFASPYKKLYADYFFGNYLSQISKIGLWGNSQTSIKDPNATLEAGLGYIAGQNILPTSRYTLDPVWGNPSALHNARFGNLLTMNRYYLDLSGNPIANVITAADKYTVEELNTVNIPVNLKTGWQYIGNPYTCPLDMGLLLNTSPDTSDPWQVIRATSGSNGIQNRYFVLAGGEGVLDNWTPDRFTINPVWLVAQKVGSTVSREITNQFVLAPMQVAAIYANNDVSINIPVSQRTHDFSSTKVTPTEEMLLEVGDNAMFDRLVLVFDDASIINNTDLYDVSKTVDSLSSTGQIFTQSGDGYAMITNVLPSTIKYIEMGLIPSLETRNKVLTVHRIQTLSKVTMAWLEDRVAGGPWINLLTTPSYSFTSAPEDRVDRFVIHINVNANSQVVAPKVLPDNLFRYGYKSIPSATSIAMKGTGPVGSVETDVQVDLSTNPVCDNSDAKVTINPTLVNVRYHAYDDYKQGQMKAWADGIGGSLILNTGSYNNLSPRYYYLDARSTDGLLTINRRLPVEFKFMAGLVYPDIRVAYCPVASQQIHLSKYLDTFNFVSVDWKLVMGNGTLSGDVLQMPLIGNNMYVNVLRYTVTNNCNTANTATMYLTPSKNRELSRDTIEVCYNTAEALQLNQIFGLEAGGEILALTPNLEPSYLKKSVTPQVFAGAVTFSAKAAYSQNGLLPNAPSKYGTDAKMAVFEYRPPSNSCFSKSSYPLVLVITSTFP